MSTSAWIVMLILVALGLAGCSTSKPVTRPGTSGAVGQSTLLSPGTAQQQQRQAERFDPYPDPRIGPEVVGGRPASYQRPATEVVQSRQTVPYFNSPQNQ